MDACACGGTEFELTFEFPLTARIDRDGVLRGTNTEEIELIRCRQCGRVYDGDHSPGVEITIIAKP